MRVEPLVPDAPFASSLRGLPRGDDGAGAFARALDGLGRALEDASSAEEAYANGAGSLTRAVYARARADVTLAVAAATVQRAAQAVQTLLNMQI